MCRGGLSAASPLLLLQIQMGELPLPAAPPKGPKHGAGAPERRWVVPCEHRTGALLSAPGCAWVLVWTGRDKWSEAYKLHRLTFSFSAMGTPQRQMWNGTFKAQWSWIYRHLFLSKESQDFTSDFCWKIQISARGNSFFPNKHLFHCRDASIHLYISSCQQEYLPGGGDNLSHLFSQ